MQASRLITAMASTVRLIAILSLVCTVGCSSNTVNNLLAKLPEQLTATAAPTSTKGRNATKSGGVPTLPHGSTCVCPTLVTGTSHGCWEAL